MEAAVDNGLLGRWVRFVEAGKVSSAESLELYCRSGRWVSQGKGRSTEGTYKLNADALCVSTPGGLKFCRQLSLAQDGHIVARGDAGRTIAVMPVDPPDQTRDWNVEVRCGGAQ